MSRQRAVCATCSGKGSIRIPESALGPREWVPCDSCCGMGMDAMPWTELFSQGRWFARDFLTPKCPPVGEIP
jgi:hypothetical protein